MTTTMSNPHYSSESGPAPHLIRDLEWFLKELVSLAMPARHTMNPALGYGCPSPGLIYRRTVRWSRRPVISARRYQLAVCIVQPCVTENGVPDR